ncbi:MAG TPA: hypothetical protein VF577_04310 [Allosphingosinicella sp.]|jgi:hypothetical protein
MLRKLLLLVAVLIVAAIGLVWANIIDLNYNQGAESPLEVRVNPVEVGTTNTNVTVPVVKTETRQVQTPSLSVQDGDPPAPAPAPANNQ